MKASPNGRALADWRPRRWDCYFLPRRLRPPAAWRTWPSRMTAGACAPLHLTASGPMASTIQTASSIPTATATTRASRPARRRCLWTRRGPASSRTCGSPSSGPSPIPGRRTARPTTRKCCCASTTTAMIARASRRPHHVPQVHPHRDRQSERQAHQPALLQHRLDQEGLAPRGHALLLRQI